MPELHTAPALSRFCGIFPWTSCLSVLPKCITRGATCPSSSSGFIPQVWHLYQDISLLLNFYLELKFEVRFFLGPLVYLFRQNVPPEAPHVPAVKTCVGHFRPKVWHHCQHIYLLFIKLLPQAQI